MLIYAVMVYGYMLLTECRWVPSLASCRESFSAKAVWKGARLKQHTITYPIKESYASSSNSQTQHPPRIKTHQLPNPDARSAAIAASAPRRPTDRVRKTPLFSAASMPDLVLEEFIGRPSRQPGSFSSGGFRGCFC